MGRPNTSWAERTTRMTHFPRFATVILLVLASLAAACSDQPGATVDAGKICDCPAAEPPLAGRIVTEHVDIADRIISANSGHEVGATCSEPQAILLSGTCYPSDRNYIDGSQTGQLLLLATRKEQGTSVLPDAWHCSFKNTSTTDVHIVFDLTCLNPAP
jgi:hypothetical protein